MNGFGANACNGALGGNGVDETGGTDGEATCATDGIGETTEVTGRGWNAGAGGNEATVGLPAWGITGFCEEGLPTGGRLIRTVSRFTVGPPGAPNGRGGKVILTVSFFGSSLIFSLGSNKI